MPWYSRTARHSSETTAAGRYGRSFRGPTLTQGGWKFGESAALTYLCPTVAVAAPEAPEYDRVMISQAARPVPNAGR